MELAKSILLIRRNLQTIHKTIDREITTANGRAIKVISVGDLNIDLPNGSKQTKTVFKNAIHEPDMAFTLISIS